MVWSPNYQQAFDKLKQHLATQPVLHLFQEGLPCQVYCDASTQGIAGVLKQVHPDGNIYPVQYYSRALRSYERNYTISELECLAIEECVDKFRVYLLGTKFVIYSDHHALQWLKTIKDPTGRLFRWSLRLSAYDYEVKYLKGSRQYEADLLSRNPFCGFLSTGQIKDHQGELRRDTRYILNDKDLMTITRRGVTIILVPPSLRGTLLQRAHRDFNHPGISQMTRLIAAQYYWDGMTNDIRTHVRTCSVCQLVKPPKGPIYGELGQLPPAVLPYELVSLDTISGFVKYGNSQTFLHVVVDHATRYAWAFPSRSTSILTYTQVIKKVIQFGSPKRLLTDRAPAFTSPKFRRFLIRHNIGQLLTTSNNLQANGLSERLNATITVKLKLLRLQQPKTAWTKLLPQVLQAYNHTPHSVTGFPPSYLLLGSFRYNYPSMYKTTQKSTTPENWPIKGHTNDTYATKRDSTKHIELPILKSYLTKTCNKIESGLDTLMRIDLEELLEQLNESFNELKLVDHEIETLLETDDLEKELQGVEEYREKYITWRFRANKKIRQSDFHGENIPNSNSRIDENEMRHYVPSCTTVKLPKLMISKFYGNFSEWLTFWNSFDAAIHQNNSLNPIDKFNYLKSHLGGTALNTVEGFALSADNYEKAIKLLKDRFGREDILISRHMNNLLSMRPLKTSSDVRTFRELFDNLSVQIRSLESLNVSIDVYGQLLCPIIIKLLPADLNLELNKELPTGYVFNDLITFLERQLTARERSFRNEIGTGNESTSKPNLVNKHPKTRFYNEKPIATASELLNSVHKSNECVFCGKDNHGSPKCDFAANMRLNEKRSLMRKKGVCYKCLRPSHLSKFCRNVVRCSICNMSSHLDVMCTKLILDRGGSSKSPTVQDETLANLSTSPDVLLPTLRVTLKGNRTEKTARAIIDTGSQRSYILHSTAMEMEYEQSRREFFRHSLFGGSSTDVAEHEVYTIHLSDINNSYRCEFEALGQPLICGSIPPVCPRSFLEGSEELDVSDLMRDRIEVLIGADFAGRLLTDDQRRISFGLVTICTKLGWTVMGKIPPTEVRDDISSLCMTTLLSLDLENLWKLDAIGVSDAEVEKKTQSLQAEMEEHFAHTTTRDIEGRYEVALPCVQDKERIPSNKDLAENQLSSVRRKLEEVGDMNEYGQIFEEWMNQGIIEYSREDKLDGVHNLPHRPVFKRNSQTSKIRPVFNASARKRGKLSLKDCLDKGPNLIEIIPRLLNKFRKYEVGVSSDMEKAFLQIDIKEEDRDAAVFEIAGVDLTGHLILKNKKKAWIVIFTCVVYKGVHLELVTSLSMEAFLQAFRRFIARIGRPLIVYSDNGTNFKGMVNALKKIDFSRLKCDPTLKNITWKFIPPGAPWWGGWWERLIGMMKQLLFRILGQTSLGYEELSTVMCDVESLMNTRPLTYLTEETTASLCLPTMTSFSLSAENRMNLKKVDGHINSSTKNGSDANQAAETSEKNANWADQVEAAEKDEDPTPFIQVKKRKASPPKSQPTKVAKSDSSAPKPAGKTRVFNRNPVAAIKNTRQQQQINKARSAAASFDQGCFIEWCPDFDHLCYMRALEEKLGRGSVFQLMRMSGHMLASLSSVEKAERLIEDGLTIGDTILRAFPYRKRAEKIIIGNLPIAVKEEDIVATLRPYCKVVSLAFEIVNCEGYSWATGNREAFILMNDGMKLHQLPGKVDIKSKGETTPAFITHGVKCSMCHRQGHRRASCPRREREERPTHQKTPRQDPARLPPTTQTPSSAALAMTPPAALGRPQETPSKSVSAPAASTPVQPTPATSAAKPPAEGVSFSSKASEAKLAVPTPPLPSVPRVQEESSREEETPKKASLGLEQLKPVLERLPDTIFKDIETAGVGRGRRDVMSFRMACLNVRGIAVRERSVELCCFLKQHAVDVAFVQETNVLALNNVRDLCLGYSAVFAPSSTPRGSGLAVIVAPGVTVLWHRVLWPGKIAIASVKIRGLETRVINCHLSHTPEERHLQLQIIAEEAIREDAWALGDINISEESSSDIGSGAVEAFAELLDRTALVDIAAIFDAAHLPTRVASYGSRVDAARLDRVLIPSRLSGRVTRYWTLNYRNSDHRVVQVGDPPSPSAPSISALLRSAPVIERIEALLSEASQEIEGNPTGDLWGKWGKLKRELVEDIKCLYVSRVEDEDYVTRASRFLRSRLEAETVEADYPSLPELGRALRVRQHRAELTTVFDAQGNLFEGMSLRRYVFNSFRERFNGSTCSPEDIAGFLEGATECITLEDSDPLHRADISLNEVEVAISRLPQGKAAGWDGIPCELVKGFEDFFGGVIHQVLAESKLRGTLPESSRRNIICLVPKAHGGPGLSGYRPISLPTADYRIVSGVLLGRLRRHLPAIVPDCQTYAVPGRCPSWNIACVSDEVALAFKNKTPLAVISTDLQSAFDNVDREFLASQLRTIGLPPPFMEWLHLLYAEADATIKVNGNFTRPFKMRRGLRQGCACSAALFSIFTGPLLRHLERILGRGNVLAYADDILLLIRENWQFERVKTIFDEFRRASGVSVYFPKSKGLWCGAWRDRADSPLGISWSASSITVLGCEITSGHGTSVQENHLLGILERAISRWSPFVRGFSLVGRARAANSLVLAAVLHHLHGYLPGDATIAKLQARLTRFVWGSCHRAAWLPGGLLARPVSVGGVGLLDIRTQLQLACFKGVQAASRNGGKNAYSWLVESGAWMTPLSSGSWLLPRRRRLLDLWGQASSILGLNHRVLPAPTLLNLPLVGACRFLATPSLRAPSRWRGVCVRDLAGPAPPPIARLTRNACEDAAALGAFCRRLVADNATSVYRERTLEEAVVLRGTATPFLRISTRTARRMLERPRLAAVPISRYLRRWAPVVDVPSTSLAFSSLRRCSFGGHAADIALRLALHALPHPGHPASSQPVCIACGSSDPSLAHRYWSCSAVRPLIREVFSFIGRPPDLQSWIFAVNLENHAITISSAAKHAIYVFFVDREMRGIAGDPLAIFHQTLQRWQRRHHQRQILTFVLSFGSAFWLPLPIHLPFHYPRSQHGQESIVECSSSPMFPVGASIEAEEGEYVIEENNRMTHTNGLRLARSLLTVTDKKTHIWITNPYPRPLKIMKDQTLAYGSLPAEGMVAGSAKEEKKGYHDMLNGHLGVARTTYRLKNKYYWPSILKDVSEFVKTCHLCQSRKGSNQLPSGLLQPIPPANYPFKRIGIDFVGPLPSTKRRRKWIIVLTDYYTKYAETKAVPEATVKEVSTFLIEHIFLRHGAPRFLINDREWLRHVLERCKTSLRRESRLKRICQTAARCNNIYIYIMEKNQYICNILGLLGPVLPDARRTSMSTLPCSRGGRRHSWAKGEIKNRDSTKKRLTSRRNGTRRFLAGKGLPFIGAFGELKSVTSAEHSFRCCPSLTDAYEETWTHPDIEETSAEFECSPRPLLDAECGQLGLLLHQL
ncbi:hypothetical protein LAZ67_2003507, partial [Cordylochernes scorpioides]